MRYLEPTDKVKTCHEILQDAQMDIRGNLTESMKPERLLKEMLSWYKITERQLLSFRYVKVRRLYMFLLREVCFLDYEKIAEIVKCRNELEVIQGIEKIKTTMRKDKKLLADARGIVDRVKTDSEMYPELNNYKTTMMMKERAL